MENVSIVDSAKDKYWPSMFFQVVSDPNMNKSGVYWSWNSNSNSFENELSEEASDAEKARKLWDVSEKLLGLA